MLKERVATPVRHEVVAAATLLKKYWGISTSDSEAIDLLNSSFFPGRPSLLEQISGFLGSSKVVVDSEKGHIVMEFCGTKEGNSSQWSE